MTYRICSFLAVCVAFNASLWAEDAVVPTQTLFTNVRIFDGNSPTLSAPSQVLVRGNTIAKISVQPIPTDKSAQTVIIDGQGKTLIPGLIDAHTHIMMATIPQSVLLTADIGFVNVAAVKAASDMLLRGFTSIRDLGGPSFGLKRGIDAGLVPGPRIWSSGAFISQTGGHGDFRLPTELPARPGDYSHGERIGASAIADNADQVRQRAREQLALGAAQIKMMAGGGVASNFDPLDVTQYTAEELRAGVEAAENWGTYVTVHAYTPRSVQQAIAAGVKCIEHGHLIDDATAKSMADHGIWWSLQPFTDDRPSAFAEGTPNRIKQIEVNQGTDNSYALAKKYHIKTAWGTDALFSADTAKRQGLMLAVMTRWYTPAEALKQATADNAELLALAGPRNPYPGKLGVVQEGALADLVLVAGDPLTKLDLVADPETNFQVIMKDGKIYKNTTK